jgi:hypothetical protein
MLVAVTNLPIWLDFITQNSSGLQLAMDICAENVIQISRHDHRWKKLKKFAPAIERMVVIIKILMGLDGPFIRNATPWRHKQKIAYLSRPL